MASVLLIDDDESYRGLLKIILESGGYEIVEAEDGKEGLKKLAESSIDLVITDIMMPEKDGIEVLVELKKRHNKLPVFAISGKEEMYLKTAQLLGACEVFKKPICPEAIITAVKKHLG